MVLLKEKCEKCGHKRVLRTENPQKCPKCGHVKGTRINKKRK
jgi:rubrerythrin